MEECISFKEIWTYITDKSVPNIKPNMYEISSFGNCRTHGKRKILIKPQVTWNGYYRYHLVLNNGNCRSYLVHRIVKIEFDCIPEYKTMQVDHIDGNKSNNCLYNLEWVDCSTNIKRAYDSGLKFQKHGEDCSWSTITNKQAEDVAKLLIQGYKHKEISELLNIPIHIIGNISTGSTWKDIYNKYNLEDYKRRKNKVSTFSDEELHLLCKYFENHPATNYRYKTDLFRDALNNLFNIKYTDNMSATLNRIYNHQTRTTITNQYNY